MLLGKRSRGPIKRTTSMSEFAFDVNSTPDQLKQQQSQSQVQQQEIQQQQQEFFMQQRRRNAGNGGMVVGGGQGDWLESRYLAALATPRPVGGRQQRRNLADYSTLAETASFLKVCGLCKRRLGPGRDTFMYRGDIAFCSLECRQQMIKEEERKEKFSLRSMKNDQPPASTGSEASGSSETVAAA